MQAKGKDPKGRDGNDEAARTRCGEGDLLTAAVELDDWLIHTISFCAQAGRLEEPYACTMLHTSFPSNPICGAVKIAQKLARDGPG